MRWLACVIGLAVAACAREQAVAPAASPTEPAASAAPAAPVPGPAPAPAPANLTLEVRTQRAGATVTISDGGDAPLTAIADGAGIAHFPTLAAGTTGDREIWATAPGAASPIARVDTLPDHVDLALAPAGTLRGRIANTAKTPGVVELAPLDLDHAVRRAPVDADGRFTFDGVPAGHWRVEATLPGFVAAATDVTARAATTTDVALAVERAGAIAGVVVDDHDRPVRDATIVVRRQDATGDHGLRIPPVFGHGRWVYPLAGHRELPANPAARFGAARVGIHIPECALGHCGIDLVAPRGTVVHAAADGTVIVARTDLRDNAGRFVAIDHGRGLVTMYMHLDQLREGLEVGQKIRAGSALGTVGSTGFDPNMAPPHLHFATTQAGGERGARAWYVDPEPMLRRAVVIAQPRSLARLAGTATIEPHDDGGATSSVAVTTDERGRFTLGELAPGTYVVLAHATGLATGASAPVEVRGALASASLVLYPGTLVRGVVTADGKPVAGATIAAIAGAGENASEVATAYTDARGAYELRALAGPVTLAATAPRYGTASRELELAANTGAQRTLDFALAAEDAELRGSVSSPDGALPGATVRIARGPSVRTVTADARGEFSFGRVARGHYSLDVSAPGQPHQRVETDSDRFVDIRLPASGALRCAIGDATSHAPLAGARLEARGPDGATATATTDVRGLATLDGLAVGRWTIATRAADHATDAREVVVTHAGAELRVDLAHTSTLAGTVRDRRGGRVAGARVAVGDATTTTDADGSFQLAGVQGTAIVVEATDATGQRGTLALTLRPGDDHANLSVELGSAR